MSLIHLLTVGRSLGTIRDAPSRYRMAEENLLPRFGTDKAVENGVIGETGTSCPRPSKAGPTEAVPAAATGRTGTGCPRPVENGKGSCGSGKKMNTETLEQSEKIAGSSTGCLRFVARPWKGWALLRNPFDGKKRSVRNRQPVQAELALDMVKPVRNDLNDTDLELIPARRVETTPAVEQVAVNKPVAVVEGLGAPTVSMTSRMMNLVGAWRGRLRMGLLKLRGGQT